MVWILTIIIAVIACIIGQIKAKEEEEAKRDEELAREEKHEQRIKDIDSVIEFAKMNDVNISKSMQERDNIHQQAFSRYFTGKITAPSKPITVRTPYSGSLISAFADWRAEEINKENQENYYKNKRESDATIKEGLSLKRKCMTIEKSIINELRSIPNSDNYIKILEKYFEEDNKTLEKIGDIKPFL